MAIEDRNLTVGTRLMANYRARVTKALARCSTELGGSEPLSALRPSSL